MSLRLLCLVLFDHFVVSTFNGNLFLSNFLLQNVGASHLNAQGKLFDFLWNPCSCKCGLPNREARLLGGEYLRGFEFPWLAVIQIRGTNSVPGTLINNKYVITSSSQVIGLTPFDVKVTLGQFDRCFPDVSSVNVSVDSIIVHEEFSPGNRAHDVALLKLSTPVVFEKRISPICLSTPGSTYLGQVATIVGWPTNVKDGASDTSTCRPRKLGLPVLDYTECLGTASDTQVVSADKRCAGVVGASSVVCKTDAGGPVMYRSYNGVYEIIGILSDKNECNEKPSSALYTTINDHLPWITRNTADACYCLKT